MDLSWFFKGFSKFPQDFPDGDENVADEPYLNNSERNSDHMDVDIFSNTGTTPLDLFQHMDSVLQRFFAGSFSSLNSENFFENTPDYSNPRSAMLKPDFDSYEPSNEMPFESKRSLMIDSDIDEKVSKYGLLMDEPKKPEKSYFCKRYTRFVRLPNGTLEEHHTSTDSKGNTTTTIRRSIGEQSFEVTTHSDAQGLKEKNENLKNLDESELQDFENRWKRFKIGNDCPQILDMQPKNDAPILNPPPGDPSYLTLFNKFFGK